MTVKNCQPAASLRRIRKAIMKSLQAETNPQKIQKIIVMLRQIHQILALSYHQTSGSMKFFLIRKAEKNSLKL